MFSVDALSCYTCMSGEDPKCGVTFDYTSSQAKEILTECEGVTTACRKLVSNDTPKGMWNYVGHCVVRHWFDHCMIETTKGVLEWCFM